MTVPRSQPLGGLVILGNSIPSVYDTAGSLSWPNVISINTIFDNRAVLNFGLSSWTAQNCAANIAAVLASLPGGYPIDVVLELGTNDLLDLVAPATVWGYLQTILTALAANTRIRNRFLQTLFPRATPITGSAASFEAKRVAQTTAGAALPGYVNGTAYSTAGPDWFTVVNPGDGKTYIFRITTSGTASTASPTWNFTLGATTALGGGAVATGYGRTFTDLQTDAANIATFGYSVVAAGADPILGLFATTSNAVYYQPGGVHPTTLSHQTIIGPTYYYPLFQQGGVSAIPYKPTTPITVTPSSGWKGRANALSLAAMEFGQPAASSPVTLGGVGCTAVVRQSDLLVTCSTPVTTRGTKTLSYTRLDGLVTSTTWSAVDAAVDSITPNAGSIDGGAGPYAIAGGGFTNGIAALSLGGVTIPLANYTVTSDAVLTINTLPAGVTFGRGDIVLTMTSGDVITLANAWWWFPSGVSRHLRFDAGLPASGSVAQWTDLSGHGRNDVQATSGNQGTIGTSSVVGGLKCVLFSKANQTVYTCSDASYTMNTRPWSVVSVYRPNNGQPATNQWILQGDASLSWACGLNGNSYANRDQPNQLLGTAVGVTDLPIGQIDVQPSSGHLHYEWISGASRDFSDASAVTKLVGHVIHGGSTTTGGWTTNGGPIDAEVFEIIEFAGKQLSASEIAFFRGSTGYFKANYGF